MKKLTNYEIQKSVRRTWQQSPVTRIKPSKKVYSRKNFKISDF